MREKYLQTGCTIYRLDLPFCRMLLILYFVASKFDLLNVNGFSLINLKSRIVEYKSQVTEHKFQIEYESLLLNVKKNFLNI